MFSNLKIIYSHCKKFHFLFLIVVIFFSLFCDSQVRDVSGEYEKIKCKDDTEPPLVRMRITKRDGNNFYTDFWSSVGSHNRDKIIYGLYGNKMKFHGTAILVFSDDFTKVYHKNVECSWQKAPGLEPLEEKL